MIVTSPPLGAALHLYVLSDHDDEDDEDEQQHEDAAYRNRQHGRVFAQFGALRSARPSRCERGGSHACAYDAFLLLPILNLANSYALFVIVSFFIFLLLLLFFSLKCLQNF